MEKRVSNPIQLSAISSRSTVPGQERDAANTIARSDTSAEVCLEVTKCLVSSALVTSAINILVAHKCTKGIDHIFRYLPADLPTVTAVRRQLLSVELDGETIDALIALNDKVETGKALVKHCQLFDGRCDDLDSAELLDLARCWREVCALGIAALCFLERSHKPFWSAERLRKADRLMELLVSARDGASPYPGPGGYPLLPHWAEQREDRRHQVNQVARVHVDHSILDAKVVDISSRGIGLNRVFGLRQGRPVVVVLADGSRFDGVVTWTAGGRAGVELCDDE